MNKEKIDIRLLDPASVECPYHDYQRLREEAPVYRMPETGWYVVTTYDLCRKVAKDWETFSDQLTDWSQETLWSNPVIPEIFEKEGWPRDAILSKDPPLHDMYRGLVDVSFTKSRIDAVEPFISKLVNELIDKFIDKGECDFIKDLAYPLPMHVIADRLGLPPEDLPRLKFWSEEWVLPHAHTMNPEREVECARNIVALQHYLAEKFEEKRLNRDDRIISDLVHGKFNGERDLTVREMMSMVEQLLVGGNETTTNAMSSGMMLLIQNPDQYALLKDDPKLIKNFVEEVLRVESPTQGIFRVAVKDVELGGVMIPRGSMINMRFGAANRDAKVFADPDRLDVCRKNAGAHLAFSTAEHHCVGAPLTRQEMNIAFKILFERMKNFQFAPGKNDFLHQGNFMVRALKHLHITFEKR